MKPTLVVLAAGLGSRYGGVKQMEGFGPQGQWLLEYSVFDAINAGFGKIIFILRDEILDDFKTHFESRLPNDVNREYVIQRIDDLPEGFTCPKDRVKPWGTGHAVMVTKPVVQENFAVINADDFYGPEAYSKLVDFLRKADSTKNEFGMIGYLLINTLSENGTVSRGVCEVNSDSMLNEVEEHTKIARQPNGLITNVGQGSKTQLTDDTVVSMNCWAFTPHFFTDLQDLFTQFLTEKGKLLKSEFYIPFAVQQLKDENRATIKVMTSEDTWFGVTYADDAKDVRKELDQMQEDGIYPDDLWGE